jgi:D-lyxose ketol-isomerase
LVDKEWGFEQVVCNELEYCAKFLHVKPGKKCSLHYHSIKKETFHLMSGSVEVETRQKNVEGKMATFLVELPAHLKQITIMPGTPHRFSSQEGAILLEISTHHDDADVVRLEPSGNL